jgi:outer membrane lipoprotein SlyB
MEWKDIASFVGKSAPILGTVLGGPAGAVLGGLVASALGVENEPSAIVEAIRKDPEAAIKLKQLENEQKAMLNKHIEAMADINLEYERTRVEERKSAHNREVQLADSGKSNLIQPLLATIGVMAFFGMVAYMLGQGLGDMTKEESFIIGNVTGMVAAIGKDIYGYYFGSSSGSKEKTQHLKAK